MITDDLPTPGYGADGRAHYADVFVMPIRDRESLLGQRSGMAMSA
jgi:hypothetical protein